MSDAEKLSDLDINVDGVTADEIIENRRAGRDLMNRCEFRDDLIVQQAKMMEFFAASLPRFIPGDYDEELDPDMDF